MGSEVNDTTSVFEYHITVKVIWHLKLMEQGFAESLQQDLL